MQAQSAELPATCRLMQLLCCQGHASVHVEIGWKQTKSVSGQARLGKGHGTIKAKTPSRGGIMSASMNLAIKTPSVFEIADGMKPQKSPQTWSNLVEMFFDQAARLGTKPFLWAKRDGAWQPLTWAEVADKVARLAGALRAIGLKPGDRVVLVSENRPEWLISDIAIMAAGGITVPAYTTNTERDHLHILENSSAAMVIVSGPKLAKVLMPAVYQSTHCKTVIGIEPLKIGQSSVVNLYDWTSMVAGSKASLADARGWATAKRTDTACIIYTSGTGGAPRGVLQHHGAILANVHGALKVIKEDFPPTPDSFLSFLPLSHAYEHTGGQYFPISMGAEIYYSEGLEKLSSNIEETKPTFMVVVPRLFEVLRQRMVGNVKKQGKIASLLLDWAMTLGKITYEEGKLSWWQNILDRIVEKLLRTKVRQRLGGRIKAMVAGGAPLNPEVGMFFHALGITLLQGYGQTEAAPIISCNRPSAKIKMHSVGPALDGVTVKIAEDGEILVQGELVMQGYWNNPEETARVLKNGWLHTGDIGHIDADGHIVITDRKKDIIVNDKGDNVAPQRVEGMLTLEPEILQAMVIGDKRPHLVGLVVPDPDWLKEWAQANGKMGDLAVLYQDPALASALQTAVDRVNKRLNVVEKVRRVAVAKEPFTVENEMMTPTLKLRRHMIKRVYGERMDALYG
jgi:long-chain acyl-CoA synthetase